MSDLPLILAIETSSRRGGVALARGAQLLTARYFEVAFNHGVELLPTIDRLCREVDMAPAELTTVCVSIGPGSFTGLRIAVTLTRTLAAVQPVSLIPVPTLEVIAQNALLATPVPQQVGVVLDAKRRQVYAAAFDHQPAGYVPEAPPAVYDPVTFVGKLAPPRTLVGEGITYHREALESISHTTLPEDIWLPRVEVVHQLGFARLQRGARIEPSELRPTYLRRPEAEEVWERRQAAKGRSISGDQPGT